MIQRVNNEEVEIANKIYELFQVSYLVEAKILKVDSFSPLERTIKDFLQSSTEFYVVLKNQKFVGAIEIKKNHNSVDIESLVVHPDYFRQGIGVQLMTFVLTLKGFDIFTVETGVDNVPAVSLYRKLGFQKVKEWDTLSGIRKIRFKKY